MSILEKFESIAVQNKSLFFNEIKITHDNVFFYKNELFLEGYQFLDFSSINLNHLLNTFNLFLKSMAIDNPIYSINIFKCPITSTVNCDLPSDSASLTQKMVSLFNYDIYYNLQNRPACHLSLFFSSLSKELVSLFKKFIITYKLSLISLSLEKSISVFSHCYHKKCDYSKSAILLEKKLERYPYFDTSYIDETNTLFTHLCITQSKSIHYQLGMETCYLEDIPKQENHNIELNANNNPLSWITQQFSNALSNNENNENLLSNQLNQYSDYLSILLNGVFSDNISNNKEYAYYLHTNGMPVHSEYFCNADISAHKQDITLILFRGGSDLQRHILDQMLIALNRGKKTFIIEKWDIYGEIVKLLDGQQINVIDTPDNILLSIQINNIRVCHIQHTPML